MAESNQLLDRCRAFVEEQSCGEWDDKTINEDAAKLHAFVQREATRADLVEPLVEALRLAHGHMFKGPEREAVRAALQAYEAAQ